MTTPSETVAVLGYQPGGFGTFVKTVPAKSIDQTSLINRESPGRYNSDNPYPTNPIGGHIELAKQAARQVTQTFGQTAIFVGEQALLHVLNPKGANIVNPLIITGAFPGEGLLGTAIDGENVIRKQAAEPNSTELTDRMFSAAAGGALGQEQGGNFFNITSIRSPSEAIDYGVNALAGALGIKDNAGPGATLEPKSASFEKRLEQNPLNPSTLARFGVYGATYARRKKISGVKVADLSKGFKPIEDGADIEYNLSDDSMLRNNLERAFESNAPADKRNRSYSFLNGLDLETDGEANAALATVTAPPVQGSGMVFPFYFESMNSFQDGNLEKFVTFQATFNGLKETYSPQWDSKIYFGRPTAIYTYQSTSRTIGFSFIIWAPNRTALGLVKQRVNWLARHCYPSYDNFGTTQIIKEAPVIKFTIGDIFRDQPGIITNLSYDWMDRWELTKDMIMPQSVEVSIQITILHDKFMRNAKQASTEGFISSDFYEFIKPNRRGISPSKNDGNGNLGSINGQITELELSTPAIEPNIIPPLGTLGSSTGPDESTAELLDRILKEKGMRWDFDLMKEVPL